MYSYGLLDTGYSYVHLMLDDDEPIGFAEVTMPPRNVLSRIWLKPEYRGQGVSTALVDHVFSVQDGSRAKVATNRLPATVALWYMLRNIPVIPGTNDSPDPELERARDERATQDFATFTEMWRLR